MTPRAAIQTPDNRFVILYRYEAGWHLSPTTKAGQGFCSNPMCEEPAVFLTYRPRTWALCLDHAQLLAAGISYWTLGLPLPEVEA